MHAKVRLVGFYGLSRSLGREEVVVRFEGRTLKDLLDHLTREYGAGVAKALLDDEGRLDPAVQVIRNGEEWIRREGLSAELQEGDSIVFLLLVAGG
jgi:molybdopterin converting factor small subunit